MKKDRNCGMGAPYPVYPPYQAYQVPMMPNMSNMMPYPSSGMQTIQSNDNGLQEQINNLDRRITKLENMMSSTSTYSAQFSDGNYHMM